MIENFTPDVFIHLALGLGLFAFGWTLFRFGVYAIGFLLGFMMGSSLYQILLEWIPKIDPELIRFFPDHPYTFLVVGAVMGIIGMILAKRVFLVLIFVGVLMGCLYLFYVDENQRVLLFELFARLGILEPLNHVLGTLWPAIFAVLIALVFLYFQKHVIIILTSCLGSYMLADVIAPILFLPLCFVGVLLQQTKRPRKKRVDNEG